MIIGSLDAKLSTKAKVNTVIWIRRHKFKIIVFVLKNPSAFIIDTSDNAIIEKNFDNS